MMANTAELQTGLLLANVVFTGAGVIGALYVRLEIAKLRVYLESRLSSVEQRIVRLETTESFCEACALKGIKSHA